MAYPFKDIEAKWQAHWESHATFRMPAKVDTSKPKYYVLDMFPYPSGEGLHVGHPEGYTASDIVARYKRMRGFNVLHPMGWDAFGLPAEQYAVRTGTHPRITTARNVQRFRAQLKSLGFSYDWQREVNTTDPNYYKWTQWIVKQLFERGLAYQSELPVWWCSELGTTLANEEVIDGKSEVGGFPCVRRPLRQWVLKITQYADELLKGLDALDWPTSTKEMQRNWIGRSEGAEIDFLVDAGGAGADGQPGVTLRVFTTRPDTLFGATYMVLAPEHELVTPISTLMEFTNVAYKWDGMPRAAAEAFVLLLAPLAPHISEELWQRLGHNQSLAYRAWPLADPAYLKTDVLEIPVQVNGKLRGKIQVPAEAAEAEVIAIAKADENVGRHLAGQSVKRALYVRGRIVNFVVGAS